MSLFGAALTRREDADLLVGAAHFVADLIDADTLHAVFVRSSAAHARLLSVATTEAARTPGVAAVFTSEELDAGRLGEFPPSRHGRRAWLERPCLATDRVRFVGEAVAVVVATSREAALDGAEAVEVDYETLPAVVDPLQALAPDAPLVFPEEGTNIVLDLVTEEGPDPLEGAELVVAARFGIQRVAPVPLEANAILASPDGVGGLVVWVSTQTPFRVRDALGEALSMDTARVRVVAPAVGGGFGAKGGVYPEHLVVAAAALRLGRAVAWVETRSENLVAMTQGRGQLQDVELGASADGILTGLRVRTVVEAGAYSWRGGIPAFTAFLMATGPYRIPRLQFRSSLVVTNTTPVGPYRGAGRPEATALLERAMDLMAAKAGLDPVELRRRNLLSPAELADPTLSGARYDSGDYAAALEVALARVGYGERRAEQSARRAAGSSLELGLGVACFVEVSGTGSEHGALSVGADGIVTVASGASPHGQGHETTLSQVAAEVLGVGTASVRVIHSDTAAVGRGTGTFGSRSGQLAGNAVAAAAFEVLARARALAAQFLEAAPEDLTRLGDGGWCVAGAPARSVSLGALATLAEEIGDALAAECDFSQEAGTYPFGTHVAVVEVDTETGRVDLLRLVAVDDCGCVLNPMIVAGQVHGGLAQGVGAALFEAVAYDLEGNPLTTTLADYLVPSAPDLPGFELAETVSPSPRNALGMKGIGESGAVGAAAAVHAAVLDALRARGVTGFDPPASPWRVWEALRAADRRGRRSPPATGTSGSPGPGPGGSA